MLNLPPFHYFSALHCIENTLGMCCPLMYVYTYVVIAHLMGQKQAKAANFT